MCAFEYSERERERELGRKSSLSLGQKQTIAD